MPGEPTREKSQCFAQGEPQRRLSSDRRRSTFTTSAAVPSMFTTIFALVRDHLVSLISHVLNLSGKQGIEERWHTTSWVDRVFAFVLATSVTNAYLIYKYVSKEELTQEEYKEMVCREFFKPAAASSTATRSTLSIVLHELRSMYACGNDVQHGDTGV